MSARTCLCLREALPPELATTARWLGELQPEPKALVSDQGGGKYFEEVLFQNQEGSEAESCPSRQSPPPFKDGFLLNLYLLKNKHAGSEHTRLVTSSLLTEITLQTPSFH